MRCTLVCCFDFCLNKAPRLDFALLIFPPKNQSVALFIGGFPQSYMYSYATKYQLLLLFCARCNLTFIILPFLFYILFHVDIILNSVPMTPPFYDPSPQVSGSYMSAWCGHPYGRRSEFRDHLTHPPTFSHVETVTEPA